MQIEKYLQAQPERSLQELDDLVAASGGTPAERRLVQALHGQAMILAGQPADALSLADRLAEDAAKRPDDLTLATALMLRSRAQLSSGDAAKANALAAEAQELARNSSDPYLRFWATLTLGITARALGRFEEALASLQDALSLAEGMGHDLRRSSALYQLSTLYLVLKKPEDALKASFDAYDHARAAQSPFAMASARMAESAAMEALANPARELAAMEEALAIARAAGAQVIESHALINLADIRLRRKEFRDALELSRRSLQLAAEFGDPRLTATSKANMGFALFGLGRISEGKRLADEALAEYERSGATAEIASLLGEYGTYLERAGEHQAALALFHRARRLHERIAAAASEKALVEIQEKYESDKRKREIALLNSENALKSEALKTQELQQRIWWLLAAVFAVSFAIVVALHRRLRVTNRLLAQKNSELSVRSSRDPLTALYNRRYFQDFMRDDRARPERRRHRDSETATRALLLIDIDRFKDINDRHGHAAGDAVLVVVARRLRDSLRETDMIVRWGGEEFLVFIPATTNERLDEIAMRVMHADSRHRVGRLCADAAAAAWRGAAMGPRDRPGRHGPLHGQGTRPQPRVRNQRALPW